MYEWVTVHCCSLYCTQLIFISGLSCPYENLGLLNFLTAGRGRTFSQSSDRCRWRNIERKNFLRSLTNEERDGENSVHYFITISSYQPDHVSKIISKFWFCEGFVILKSFEISWIIFLRVQNWIKKRDLGRVVRITAIFSLLTSNTRLFHIRHRF